ncbi:MAG: small multi-drug export protein [Actinobacteria bacterium]|nr:small multi-drug export protein [Actinomycetota bacterium]
MKERLFAAVAGSRTGLLFSESWYLHWLGGIPVWLRTVIISMIPVIELRGAIPAAKYWGAGLGTTFLWSLLGNMLPIPFILLLLGPISDWLRRRSPVMDRFFSWLFARTRRKHGRSFARWRDAALCLFVAIPLPGTGAWTGALAAFVFDVPFSHALPAIFLGVLIAATVVTLVVYFVSTVPLWVTMVSAAAMLLLLLAFWWASRREEGGEERPDPVEGETP